MFVAHSTPPTRKIRPRYVLLLAMLGLALHLLAPAVGLGTPRGELFDPDAYMKDGPGDPAGGNRPLVR
jgi:hypothetical protein